MTPLVSVVIPTWNRADLVLECLDSLSRQTHAPIEIIVVDDASTDDTLARVHARYPEVALIPRTRNGGFARAANDGVRAAKGTWILMLNNDVTVEADLVERMLARAEESSATMIAPLLLWRDDPQKIYSAGDRIRQDGRPEAIGFRQEREGFEIAEPAFGVSAACGLYHRDIFDNLGAFEESFVAYFEDADLCFRARLAGHQAAVAMDVVAYHIGSASIHANTWWRSAQCYRNHALLVTRNFPTAVLLRRLPAILRERRHQRAMMFRAARAQFGALHAAWIALHYMAWLAASLPRAVAQRLKIQRLRSVPTSEVMAWLAPHDASGR